GQSDLRAADGKYLGAVSDWASSPPRHDSKTFQPDTTDQKRATVVQVTAGGESTGVDIRLGHTQLTYVITGRVIGQDSGKPLSGVSIKFSGWNDGREGFATTDSNGIFKIEDCVL